MDLNEMKHAVDLVYSLSVSGMSETRVFSASNSIADAASTSHCCCNSEHVRYTSLAHIHEHWPQCREIFDYVFMITFMITCINLFYILMS